MIRVGFTGTQQGMTDEQKASVEALFHVIYAPDDAIEVHHGDCVGADADFHDLAENWVFDIEIHPPTDDSKRAFCHSPVIHPPKPYMERNHDIVDATTILIACPNGAERMRSGTWATVRYARTLIYDGKEQTIHIVTPTGEVKREGRSR